ncbi:MAG: lyase family protein, partial [Elusimicrobiota bacterium]
NRAVSLMESSLEYVSYGKISGAVGTFAHFGPEIEVYVCKKLGLKPEPVSTQIIPRDRYASYLCNLAVVASSIEKFAVELRTLQRTEILEVEEAFSRGQKGSSAMPHKRNPISCEQICGLARVVRSNCITGLENIALWGERDISHSAAERIVIPDTNILLDYILHRFNFILENLVVYPRNMMENLKKSQETFFSQTLMLNLIKKGLSRNDAYKLMQDLSQKAFLFKKKLRDYVLQNKTISGLLTEKEINNCFEIKNFTANIDRIFRNVFLNPEP